MAHKPTASGVSDVKFAEPLRHGVYARDGHKCQYCNYADKTKAGLGLALDHFNAKATGGDLKSSKNLITSCIACNSSKQHLSIKAFERRLASKDPPPGGIALPKVDQLKAQLKKPVDLTAGKTLAAEAAKYRVKLAMDAGHSEKEAAKQGVYIARVMGKEAAHEHQRTSAGQINLPGTDGPGVQRDPETGKFLPGAVQAWAKARA